MLSLSQRKVLISYARVCVENAVGVPKTIEIPKGLWLEEKKGIFVTIHKNKELRGCIGFTEPIYTLKEGIKKVAILASFEDPRFPPVKKEELKEISFEVSVLSDKKLIEHKTPKELSGKITPKTDGLVLEYGEYVGLFLPQVWKQINTKEEFLKELCFKAGLNDSNAWKSPRAKIYRFSVQAFGENTKN
ncbi:MAG: AmmeMemoRadiSam system protein A [Candidatus Aenigmarchaeota archaeon]|nr:AmmeMemoRadiSam system protein A [Candidatus Aenigmarchaeota archaeon]